MTKACRDHQGGHARFIGQIMAQEPVRNMFEELRIDRAAHERVRIGTGVEEQPAQAEIIDRGGIGEHRLHASFRRRRPGMFRENELHLRHAFILERLGERRARIKIPGRAARGPLQDRADQAPVLRFDSQGERVASVGWSAFQLGMQ
jgi:hypothetical protein